MDRTASCSCGALTALCRGEPVRLSVCHCLACQRRTGSVFGAQATFRESDVVLSGTPVDYTRTGDEGHWVRTSFCGRCGSTVWYRIERRPGMVSIPIGAFADPTFPPPTISIYESRRYPWVEFAGDVEIERHT